ncbi:hypothetical protein ACIOG4_28510 [Streptomyces microflavus]|uniref:hypothetical protein n=1 Tax=Streptomyces microflavus TaxID=1919 RepID=UPI003803BB84
MSATATPAGVSKPDTDRSAHPTSLVPLLATAIALIAAVLALLDLFHNGLATTTVHLIVGLAVFSAVRFSVGLALAPHRPDPPDDSEST